MMKMPKSTESFNYLENWEQIVNIPNNLKAATSDEEICSLYQSGEQLIRLQGGNLYTSLGGNGLIDVTSTEKSVCLQVDLGEIYVSKKKYLFASHCRMSERLKPWKSTWVINSPVVSNKRLAPKGHPADGIFEIVEFQMTLRQSLIAYNRSKSGDHVPHPDIKLIKKRDHKGQFSKPMRLSIDGGRSIQCNDYYMQVLPHAIRIIVD